MSCDWQFRCKHCYQTDWADANHVEGDLVPLLKNGNILRNAIIVAHVLCRESYAKWCGWGTVISLEGRYSLKIDLCCFQEDCEHVFEAVSEYGHIIGEDGVCHDPPHWEKKVSEDKA